MVSASQKKPDTDPDANHIRAGVRSWQGQKDLNLLESLQNQRFGRGLTGFLHIEVDVQQGLVDLRFAGGADVGIDIHGGGQLGMTQQPLHILRLYPGLV